jgi:hypothetical protein
MSHGSTDGKYYRSRAEDCRTVAEDYLEADARQGDVESRGRLRANG